MKHMLSGNVEVRGSRDLIEAKAGSASPTLDISLEALRSQEFVDEDNLVIEAKKVEGGSGLKFTRCRNVTIRNLEISGSRFSGLWFNNCQDVVVEGGRYHHNGRMKGDTRVGHGIFLSGGDTQDILIKDVECFENWEDGVQQNKNLPSDVLIEYQNCRFYENGENGFDGKGGQARFLACEMWGNGSRQKGMEVVILHKGFSFAEFEDCVLKIRPEEHYASCINASGGARVDVRNSELDASAADSFALEGKRGCEFRVEGTKLRCGRVKPLVRIDSGSLFLLDSQLKKPRKRNWIVHRGKSYGREEVLVGIDTPDLHVSGIAEG